MRSIHIEIAAALALAALTAAENERLVDSCAIRLVDSDSYPYVTYKWGKMPPHEMSRPQYKNLVLKNSRRGRARKRR